MNKIIIAVIVIVLIAIAAYVFMKPVLIHSTPIPSADNSAEVSSVLGEQYSSLIEEELNKLSIEQTDFNNYVQDKLADDLSQFYY